MASESEQAKQRLYDPSMSRRTRKPPTTTTKSSQDEDEEPQKKSNSGFQEPQKKSNSGFQEPQKKSNNGVQEQQKKSNNGVQELQKKSNNGVVQEPQKKRNNGVVQEQQKKSNIGVQEPQKKSNNGFHRVSLKELLKEGNEEKDESGNEVESRTDQGNGDGMKPMESEETAAEKHLPMVRKRGEGIEGAKMAGLVSRYAKVLNHLIKVKRSSKKKNAVQLLM